MNFTYVIYGKIALRSAFSKKHEVNIQLTALWETFSQSNCFILDIIPFSRLLLARVAAQIQQQDLHFVLLYREAGLKQGYRQKFLL